MFVNDAMGELVDITGSDPVTGGWQHKAFIPAPLGSDEPPLNGSTYRMVAAAGRALAALDATAQQLPNPYPGCELPPYGARLSRRRPWRAHTHPCARCSPPTTTPPRPPR